MKKYLIFSLVILLFLSCNHKNNNNSIALFNGYRININETEKLFPLSPQEELIYNNYCNNRNSIQIPVYKLIEGKNYKLFIGLPLHFSTERILAIDSLQNVDSLIFNISKPNSYYRSFIKDSFQLTERIEKVDDNSFVAFFLLNNINIIQDSVEINRILLNRVIKE